MEFDPRNPIVKCCIQAMALAERGKPEEAYAIVQQAFEKATDPYEKFLVAYFVAQYQEEVAQKLQWYRSALEWVQESDTVAARSAFFILHTHLGECYEALQDQELAQKHYAHAASMSQKPLDNGPFYHGTKAHLKVGDLLVAGGTSNYQEGLTMNHIYFTALANGAGLAASLAKGEGKERVYRVEPTGDFENDPNVTDKKFPGNPTRSYRSKTPLKIVGEIADWKRQTQADIAQWKAKLANNKGEIIN